MEIQLYTGKAIKYGTGRSIYASGAAHLWGCVVRTGVCSRPQPVTSLATNRYMHV